MDAEDRILSELISGTRADPSLARDLLQNVDWDVDRAADAFARLNLRSAASSRNDPDSQPKASLVHRSVSQRTTTTTTSVPAADAEPRKSLHRGLSFGNSELVRKLRDGVRSDVDAVRRRRGDDARAKSPTAADHSFVLPDFSRHSDDFQVFLRKDLVDTATQCALENSGHLNWCSSCVRLLPLGTAGDGNCLLHAASLAVWGIHDRQLTLRQTIEDTLRGTADALRRRWKYEVEQRNKKSGGLVYSEAEWEREWQDVVRFASCEERKTNDAPHAAHSYYESLEEIHVFALAHVLRRPIVVLADSYLRNFDGEPIAPVYFGGVYLPLEWSPSKCYKMPLLLAYEASHFAALVAVDWAERDRVVKRKKFTLFKTKTRERHADEPLLVAPLQSAEGNLLPVRFAIDALRLKELGAIKKAYAKPGGLDQIDEKDMEKYQLKLMKKYLNIVEFDVKPESTEPEENATTKAEESPFSSRAIGSKSSHQSKLSGCSKCLGCQIDLNKLPPGYNALIENYMLSARERYQLAFDRRQRLLREREANSSDPSEEEPKPSETKKTGPRLRDVGRQDTRGLGGHYDEGEGNGARD